MATTTASLHEGLAPETLGQVFDPKKRVYPPDLTAGEAYELTFGLPQDKEPFETKTMGPNATPTLVVNFEIGYTITKADTTTIDRVQKYQSANFYQSPKMKEKGVNSGATRLLLALFGKGNIPQLVEQDVKDAFTRAAAQGLKFTGVVGWRTKDKATGTYYDTHGQTKNWPRGADGKWEPILTMSDGTEQRGNIDVVDFRAKK